MKAGIIIKRIREDARLMQKEVSAVLATSNSNYNNLENGNGDLSAKELLKLPFFFNTTIEEILNYSNVVPTAIKGEGKPDIEKLHLINQLQEENKQTGYKIIDTMLTKQKF